MITYALKYHLETPLDLEVNLNLGREEVICVFEILYSLDESPAATACFKISIF